MGSIDDPIGLRPKKYLMQNNRILIIPIKASTNDADFFLFFSNF